MVKYLGYFFIWVVLLYILSPAYALNPVVIKQGEVTIFSVPMEKGLSQVVGQDGGRTIPFFKDGDRFLALISADIRARAGSKEIILKKIYLNEGKNSKKEDGERLYVKVEKVKFGFQEFKVTTPTIMAPALIKRLKREKEEIDRVLRLSTPKKWERNFVHPLDYRITGKSFGFERVINGVRSKPHTGADYSVPLGSKIRAINTGKVALVANHYFAGRCVFIDHGLGLISMYFHMGRVYIRQGQMVEKGQVIGIVGLTGRASGPHLHLGIRLQEDRIDPDRLIELTF